MLPLEVLAAVLEEVDYGVLLTDRQHKSLLCNSRFGEIFAVSTQAVVENDAEKVRDMVGNRIVDIDLWQQNLDAVYADESLVYEDELLLKNPFAVLRRFTGPVHNGAGNITARLWTFLDVTKSWQLRQFNQVTTKALSYFSKEPKDVCQYVLDLISDTYGSTVLLSIQEGDFLRFTVTSGLPPELSHVQGNTLDESYCQFCIGDSRPTVIQDSKVDPKTRDLLPSKLGFTRYAGVPLQSPEGKVIGTLCILDSKSEVPFEEHDISFLNVLATRINSELERASVIKRLELGLERTHEDLRQAEQQLFQSEKLAVVGTLAASIAHDIRNILASMSLQISMAEEHPERSVSFIRDSLARFDVLAHRLLSYAKPSKGLLETVELSDNIQGVCELLRAQFQMSKVDLEYKKPPNPVYILGDPGRLEHLFVNLVTNALQAMRTGGGKVTISVSTDEKNAIVTVKDDGPGIPAHLRDTVYEPFVSTSVSGFGLGLYSCSQIVLAHNGSIKFECPDSGGTEFTLTFPKDS